ncbi:hypothetical protein [Streptomyces sp. VRA16 Mangrove soil]|uniref:hypothetical protein n=1 Tax=Streptomyces sp. VRA16 Mangrove soil TaxID=2817434 RepID=UPI001A9F7D67|nr:hypothetical protein [Streptomyces sp. VRA16 Mangrove soil]MBO1337876.1 hypothetical protein [Streptomyces sp. VRA16 Mangrove soil]
MHTGLKITAFAAAAAAAFGTAYGVGSAADPVVAGKQPAAHGDEHGGGHAEAATAAADVTPGGLQVSERGYTLALERDRLPGRTGELRFTIRKDSTGAPVTSYKKEHGKELHLIVASRDLTAYRHLHPVRAADGTWSTPVSLPKSGDYRVFADFTPRGEDEGLTLGAGLGVAGTYRPQPLPEHSTKAKTEDGYEVRVNGELTAGKASELTLSVSRDGKPVTDLEPYLGAYGHLVALRSGDLAYLHVHPHDGRPGPEVSFTATAPSTGTYRLFLDFKHDGEVRTAAFTVHAA